MYGLRRCGLSVNTRLPPACPASRWLAFAVTAASSPCRHGKGVEFGLARDSRFRMPDGQPEARADSTKETNAEAGEM